MKTTLIYKTAAELGIEQWEHDGLVALIGPLSRGELLVSMRTAADYDDCGTAHCIGGWLASNRKLDPQTYVNHDASWKLGALFYPGGAVYDTGFWDGFVSTSSNHIGWNASASEAATAIVNFLTLGDPRWDDVMWGTRK